MNCPYCNQVVGCVSGKVIYPHRHDLAAKRFWYCKPCQAWVGCHPGDSDKPLGRLANAELRQAKVAAHKAFDKRWKHKGKERADQYSWLANKLGIKTSECHIGMMDVGMCKRVIDACEG